MMRMIIIPSRIDHWVLLLLVVWGGTGPGPQSSWTTRNPTTATVGGAPSGLVHAMDFRLFWNRRIVPWRTKHRKDLFWNKVPQAPPDAILGIAQAFRECTDPHKVNVCVGAYRDDEENPWVLPSVRAAEQALVSSDTDNKEYLPIEGDVEFLAVALELIYGPQLYAQLHPCMAKVQTLSGTGACCVGGHFLAHFLHDRRPSAVNDNDESEPPTPRIYLPVPTWTNHWNVFRQCGLDPHPYRYYNPDTNGLDMEGLLEDLRHAPRGSAVLLHACAHNPTGCDPTRSQWLEIGRVMRDQGHVAFFDSAYQGFASGNAPHDAENFQTFCAHYGKTVPILLAQSFAKNFGLYGERCGTLSILCNSPQEQETVTSQLRTIIRPMYSSPPRHGSSIVKTILGNATLREQYQEECATMARRIQGMRHALVQALADAGSTLDWSHLQEQTGMFAYTSHLTPERCDALTRDFSIYLTRNGRLSLAGLNPHNLPHVAQAIHHVTSTPAIEVEEEDDNDEAEVEDVVQSEEEEADTTVVEDSPDNGNGEEEDGQEQESVVVPEEAESATPKTDETAAVVVEEGNESETDTTLSKEGQEEEEETEEETVEEVPGDDQDDSLSIEES